jgi:hypothetical protein
VVNTNEINAFTAQAEAMANEPLSKASFLTGFSAAFLPWLILSCSADERLRVPSDYGCGGLRCVHLLSGATVRLLCRHSCSSWLDDSAQRDGEHHLGSHDDA